MCLRVVEQGFPNRSDLYRSGIGWKVYRREGGKLKPVYRGLPLDAKPGKGIICSDDFEQVVQDGHYRRKRYMAGFHLFMDRADAEQVAAERTFRVVCRVRWRGLCAVGTETSDSGAIRKVLVVHEIVSRKVVKVGE